MPKLAIICILLFAALSGCEKFVTLSDCIKSDNVVSLYRSSVVNNRQYHVATFDVDEPGDHNSENCQIAAGLFQNQPGVSVKYWCENGRNN